jgi:hypothetical protein
MLDEASGFLDDLGRHPGDRPDAVDERFVVRTTTALATGQDPRAGVGTALAEVAVVVEAPGHPEPPRLLPHHASTARALADRPGSSTPVSSSRLRPLRSASGPADQRT